MCFFLINESDKQVFVSRDKVFKMPHYGIVTCGFICKEIGFCEGNACSNICVPKTISTCDMIISHIGVHGIKEE